MKINDDFNSCPLLLKNEKLQGTAYDKRHSMCLGAQGGKVSCLVSQKGTNKKARYLGPLRV